MPKKILKKLPVFTPTSLACAFVTSALIYIKLSERETKNDDNKLIQRVSTLTHVAWSLSRGA